LSKNLIKNFVGEREIRGHGLGSKCTGRGLGYKIGQKKSPVSRKFDQAGDRSANKKGGQHARRKGQKEPDEHPRLTGAEGYHPGKN